MRPPTFPNFCHHLLVGIPCSDTIVKIRLYTRNQTVTSVVACFRQLLFVMAGHKYLCLLKRGRSLTDPHGSAN